MNPCWGGDREGREKRVSSGLDILSLRCLKDAPISYNTQLEIII